MKNPTKQKINEAIKNAIYKCQLLYGKFIYAKKGPLCLLNNPYVPVEIQTDILIALRYELSDEHKKSLTKSITCQLEAVARERSIRADSSYIQSDLLVMDSWVECLKKLHGTEHFGLQPITAPVGMIFELLVKSADDKNISMQIVSDATEAFSRKLKAQVCIETIQDVTTLHGLDDGFISDALGQELYDEIVAEINTTIVNQTTDNESVKLVNNILGFDLIATEIGQDTRRGLANTIFIHPENKYALELQQHNRYNLVPYQALPKDEVVMCYSGTSTQDRIAHYSPYVLRETLATSPDTFAPALRFTVRYGLKLHSEFDKRSRRIKTE